MKSSANSVSELSKSSNSTALVNAEPVLSKSQSAVAKNKPSKKIRKAKVFQTNKLGFSNNKHTYRQTLFAHKLGKDSQMTYVYAAILPSSFFILGMLFIMSFMH